MNTPPLIAADSVPVSDKAPAVGQPATIPTASAVPLTVVVAAPQFVSALRTADRALLGPILLIGLIVGCGKHSSDSSAAGADVDAIQRVSEKGPVKLSVRIVPPEPRLSDFVEMDITVTAEPDVEIIAPAFGEAVGDFLIRDYSERSPQGSPSGSSNTRTFHYQLEPASTGTHLIRSIAIEFVDNRQSSESKGSTSLIESDPIEIKVTSELGDDIPDLARLEPMIPPQPIAASSSRFWLIAILLAAGAFVVFLWRRRRHASHMPEPERLTPAQIAHEALHSLLAENLPAQGLFRDFYVRLTGIVRVYIESTTGLKAPEQTTEEFLHEMRSQNVFPADRSVRLTEFLEAADMVKYAGQQPDSRQIDLSIQRAREFISPER